MPGDSANAHAEPSRGVLLIISGPSGTGKSTLVEEVIRLGEFPIVFSVSATSRVPRPGEVDGKHYRFLDRERFEEMRGAGAFLEHAQVHGHLYGTPKDRIEEDLAKGRWVLLEIDVQGHLQVKAAMPEAISFFIRTPSLEVYEERLRARGTESEDQIVRRLSDVREQLAEAANYDFQIVNETIPQSVRTFRTLLWGLQTLRRQEHVG